MRANRLNAPSNCRKEDNISSCAELARVIEQQSDALLTRWRTQVRELPAAKGLDTPTLNDHIPHLLLDLAAALRARTDESIADAVLEGSPPAHGLQRLADGFDIEEVVAEYNILRGCIHDLADRNGLSMHGTLFHILNRVLDGAIGSAVQSFAAQQALEVQRRREEYLAFVAHDLRTPLNAISLSVRALQTQLERSSADSPQAAPMLRALTRNVQYLQALVNRVLEENTSVDAEAGVMLQRRQFDLWPLVESLVQDMLPVAGTVGTRLTNAVPEELVVYADASLLKRVLQNLIANAITHTPRGEIVIGARAASDDVGAECFVRDNGGGIATERLQRVFDKYETDSDEDGALGLGLAIVRTFVEAHDGTVTVESTLGAGSTFRFTLPGRGR